MIAKRVACVTWLMNDIGGVSSWTENFLEGLRRLGQEAPLFYCTHQRTLNCDLHKKVLRSGGRYHLLPARHLSYVHDIKYSLEVLRQFNTVIFLHPSPHPTKEHLLRADGNKWREIYRGLRGWSCRVVVFHDKKWEDNNWWFVEVKEDVDVLIAAQKRFLSSVKRYPADIPKLWSYFPLDLQRMKRFHSETKEKYGVLATQWLSFKNHKIFVPLLPEIRVPMRVFGDGIVRSNMNRDGKMTPFENGIHSYEGFTDYQELQKIVAKARLSIDLSRDTCTNMTHWEPLALRTPSLMEKTTAEDPHNQIPVDCVEEYELSSVVERINSFQENAEKTDRAWDFVQRCDCVKVAENILKRSWT